MNGLLKFLRIIELLVLFVKCQKCIVVLGTKECMEYDKEFMEYNIECINMIKEEEKLKKKKDYTFKHFDSTHS